MILVLSATPNRLTQKTPTVAVFNSYGQCARAHLAAGHEKSPLPATCRRWQGANTYQFGVLYGFPEDAWWTPLLLILTTDSGHLRRVEVEGRFTAVASVQRDRRLFDNRTAVTFDLDADDIVGPLALTGELVRREVTHRAG